MAKKTYSDHAAGLADDARQLAANIRDDIQKLRDDAKAHAEKAAPEPYEAPVSADTARLMAALDDVERTLDGIRQIAADLERTAVQAAPPES